MNIILETYLLRIYYVSVHTAGSVDFTMTCLLFVTYFCLRRRDDKALLNGNGSRIYHGRYFRIIVNEILKNTFFFSKI